MRMCFFSSLLSLCHRSCGTRSKEFEWKASLSMHHPDLHGPLSRIFFPVASRKRVCLASVCIIITAVFQSFMSAPPVHPVCRADVSLDRVCTFGLGLPRCFHTRRSYKVKVIFECFSILV
ncbi:uncharacterized protein BO66DRAFT_147942 [Aspergillus aculeatinus CBS 121060]|uniref:Uncharacterized protein n=1 Tax=Aspergillus aculeatinus CBS 121060 TaxID=1448322 RepID=A0ACD1HL29_9EURO|nr:hypothetical protein BO66DRAFT_147942 [Aspergillus aculeatinus CBS 121060]RAH74377.1 hypothetical protein BO66DRAFT_147942 [Aspergillus aculeatinus CBS 121060]